MGNGMNKVLPGLYLGNFRDARDESQLDENKITHILSIHDKAKPAKDDKEYLCISASDNAAQDLTCYFSQCNDFIHKARLEGGNVLVHCLAGVSRSVTITVAYMMTVTELEWRHALNAVRGARRVANPNYGFQRQLMTFQHEQLPKEKIRLRRTLPPSPHDDAAESRILLKIHDQWVRYGDDPAKVKATPPELYPLPHNAYTSDVKATDSSADGTNVNLTSQATYGAQESKDLEKGQGHTSSASAANEVKERYKNYTKLSENISQKKSLIDELFDCIDGPRPRGNVIIYSPAKKEDKSRDSDAMTSQGNATVASTVYVCDGESLRLESGGCRQETESGQNCPSKSSASSSIGAVTSELPRREKHSSKSENHDDEVTVADIFESSKGRPR